MEEINTEKIKTQMRKGILEMCILSVIDKSKEAYAGPPRKYYVLTDSGKLFLTETLKAWRELQTMIDKII